MPSHKLKDIAGKFCGLYITWSFGTNTGHHKVEHFTLIIGTKINDSWSCIQSYLLSFLLIWLSPNNLFISSIDFLSLVISPIYYVNKWNWYIWKKMKYFFNSLSSSKNFVEATLGKSLFLVCATNDNLRSSSMHIRADWRCCLQAVSSHKSQILVSLVNCLVGN